MAEAESPSRMDDDDEDSARPSKSKGKKGKKHTKWSKLNLKDAWEDADRNGGRDW